MAKKGKQAPILAGRPWDKYRVEIQFRDRLLGGVPVDQEIIKQWVLKSPAFRDLTEEVKQQIIAEKQQAMSALSPEDRMSALDREVAEQEKMMLTGFPRDDDGLYIEARQVRACFREAATTAGLFVAVKKGVGGVGMKQTLQHGFCVRAVPYNPRDRLYLGKSEADGIVRSVAHVTGPMGPRSCFKAAEYVETPRLVFDVWIMANGAIDEDIFELLCDLIGEVGLGKDRSQGNGKFDVLDWKALIE